jgi:hypothetical protein
MDEDFLVSFLSFLFFHSLAMILSIETWQAAAVSRFELNLSSQAPVDYSRDLLSGIITH